MKIIFIQTGGTIDKDYPQQTKGYAFEITEPAVKRILDRLNPDFQYEIIPLLQKDSLDLTDEDRKKIYDSCVHSSGDKIIVTHGTDTLIETARFLSTINKKVIVLTGSFKPERFFDSEAPINLGVALGGVSSLGSGIYVAMNGRIFTVDNVMRDPETGQFAERQKTD
ncbi:MAG: asparaginase domain-containing protein [Candidatus Aminicenantes bacterium]|nr:asparaginase domain-containing protein [Candidatus Aminicenantes bacterium]